MRVLGIGSRIYLGDIYVSLMRDGHDVRVYAEDAPEQRAFAGLIEPVADWRDHLDWVGRDGVIMFERVGAGALQDSLRASGHRVVGGSALGDRLENDRAFGQDVLRRAGLPVAGSRAFPSPAAAADWLLHHPGRYVLKHDSSVRVTFVGEHPDGADLAFMLRRAAAQPEGDQGILLMDRLDGVEVGVGAYFNGQRFLEPANLDFEHKRFFPGDLGEMTGEMGTLASFEGADRLFDATLGRVAPVLAAAGHVGYVNLNMMADERGVWPLEFTCRFGNPGFAVLAALQLDGWGGVLAAMAGLDAGGRIATAPGWSVATVLTTPPFPAWSVDHRPEEDAPVFFHQAPQGREAANYHFVDMRRQDGQLFVRTCSGHVMIVTGTGPSVADAQDAARARARNVIVPNLRWRADIGDRFLSGDRETLRRLGWLA